MSPSRRVRLSLAPRLLRPSPLRALPAAFVLALFLSEALLALPPSRFSSPLASPALLDYHPVAKAADDGAFASGALLTLVKPSSPGLDPREFADRALVLCWHSFLGRADYPTDFSLAEFAAQIDAIRALGYRFRTVEELLDGRLEGSRNVVVTIDDGHRTVPQAIEKVLAPRLITPTLFVYPAVLGTTDFAMSDVTLAALVRAGIPVGSHGYHHLYVTEALYRDDPRAFLDEIYKSKDKAESLSGSFVLCYAYPFGALSPRTKSEVRKAGFAAAFAVKPGFVYADSGLNDGYELPRLVVTRQAWPEILALLERNAAGAKSQ